MESQEQTATEGTMPLMQHLDELRIRLLRFAVVLLLCVLAAYSVRKELLDIIRAPVEGPLQKYSQKKIAEAETEQAPAFNLNSLDCRCLPTPANEVRNTKEAHKASKAVTPSFPLASATKPIAEEEKISVTEEASSFFQGAYKDFKALYYSLTGREKEASLVYQGDKTTNKMQEGAPLLGSNNSAITEQTVMNLSCSCRVKEKEKTSHMVYIGLPELFFAQMKIAIYTGIFIAFPYLLLEIWGFIGPALYRTEKSFFWFFALFSYLFFIGGALFGYFMVFPYGIDFFLSLSQPGEILPSLSIGEFLGFTLKLFFAFGAIFELPLVVFLLSRLGIVTPELMISQARTSLIVIMILSAMLTPPDPFTMMLMAGPLMGLYILSIGVSFVAVSRKKAALRKQGLNADDF